MAVVQYTAVVNQVRGKLNGSVFNKARTVNTLQRKQQQPVGARGFQSEIRNIFSSAQRRWKSLGISVQEQWQLTASSNPARDRFGNQVVLSGYNQFIKASVLAEYANAPQLTVPYTSPAPDNGFVIADFAAFSFSVASNGSTQIDINADAILDSYSSAWGVILDVSMPISRGVTEYHGRWVNISGSVMTAQWSPIETVVLGVKYPLPQVGQRVRFRWRLVHIPSGAVVSELVESANIV